MHLLFGGNFGNKAITKKSCSKNSAKQSSIFTAPYLINTNSNNEKHFNWTVMLFWNLYYIFEMVQIWFIFHFYTIKRKLVITVFKLVSFRVKNNCTGKYATSTFNYWFVHHVMIQYQIQMYLAIWTNFLTFYVRFGWGKLALYYGFFPLDISSLLNWTSICSQKYHLLHLSLSLFLFCLMKLASNLNVKLFNRSCRRWWICSSGIPHELRHCRGPGHRLTFDRKWAEDWTQEEGDQEEEGVGFNLNVDITNHNDHDSPHSNSANSFSNAWTSSQ